MSDAPGASIDRRPIAARRLAVFQRLASALARRRVSANAISTAGMVFGIAAGAALFLTPYLPAFERLLWIAAAVLVQLRLLANMLDGMVAIESGTASRVGELFNEVPDRVSDSATLIGLGHAVGGDIVIGYAAALAAMSTAYVRAVGKTAGAPQDFCGPMAKQHRMFLVTLTCLFCAAAPVAWRILSAGPLRMGVPAAVLVVILAGSLVTAVRRLLRAGAALRSRP